MRENFVYGERKACECKVCGAQMILPKSLVRKKNYCSEKCKQIDTTATCETCGKVFKIMPYQRRQKNYCSEECRPKKKIVYGERKACECKVCSAQMILPQSLVRIRRNYCSEKCKQIDTTATCETCGKVFKIEPSKRRQKNYCSEECKPKKKTYICEVCGKECRPRDIKAGVFCSKECRKKAYFNCVCKTCGKKLHRNKAWFETSKVAYCSVECMGKGNAKDKIKICLQCGEPFNRGHHSELKFCSRKCAGLYIGKNLSLKAKAVREEREKERKARAEERAEIREMAKELKGLIKELKEEKKRLESVRECSECGALFFAEGPGANARKTCSEKCSRRRENRRKDKRIKRNGKPDYSITLTKLFKRDGGVCALCGLKMKMEGDIQSGDYPSIDHIIPISRGGLHSWDNVQLVCRRCNWEKGNNTPPPLT